MGLYNYVVLNSMVVNFVDYVDSHSSYALVVWMKWVMDLGPCCVWNWRSEHGSCNSVFTFYDFVDPLRY